MPIRRVDTARLVPVARLFRSSDAHTPCERQIAFAVEQGLPGNTNSHKGSRARGLNAQTGTFQIEFVRSECSQIILVIADKNLNGAQQTRQSRVLLQLIEIRTHCASRINADRAVEFLWIRAAVLERMPRTLQK